MTRGKQARELAARLGISVTRARRALDIGVEAEAAQYAKTHAGDSRRSRANARAARSELAHVDAEMDEIYGDRRP